MPKATFTLPDGTEVAITGAADEIKQLLDHYGERTTSKSPISPPKGKTRTQKQKAPANMHREENLDITQIVNKIKECDDCHEMYIVCKHHDANISK